jgi:hypothetical protein
MDILVLISGFLQNFLGIGQLEEGEVLKGLLEGRVGGWEGFDCGEKGIDITVTRSASHSRATGPGLSYHEHLYMQMTTRYYTESYANCAQNYRIVDQHFWGGLITNVSSELHGEQRQWQTALIETLIG